MILLTISSVAALLYDSITIKSSVAGPSCVGSKYSLRKAKLWLDEVKFVYETTIWTGITCKKIPCYMHDSACRWFKVKKAKMFWNYDKHSWILAGMTKCRILIGLCK